MNSEAEAGVGVGFPGGPGAPNNGDSPAAAIINPTREAWDEPVTARVILTFTLPDYRYLCRLVQPKDSPRYVYNCALREGRWDGQPITLAAPALGAPYAVMVMEKLMVLGARMVLALGWCGSLQSGLSIGDLVLPSTTVSTEGTSRHYPLNGRPGPGPGAVRSPAGLAVELGPPLAGGSGLVHRRLLPGNGAAGSGLPGPGSPGG